MKYVIIALSERERVQGRSGEDNLTSVQCKAIQNCNNKSPLYSKYILIKINI
jgi:hypothetical protein